MKASIGSRFAIGRVDTLQLIQDAVPDLSAILIGTHGRLILENVLDHAVIAIIGIGERVFIDLRVQRPTDDGELSRIGRIALDRLGILL